MRGWLPASPQVLYVPCPARLSGVRTHLKNLDAPEKGRERQRQSLEALGTSALSPRMPLGLQVCLLLGDTGTRCNVAHLVGPMLYEVRTDSFCWGPEGLADH